LVRPRGSPAVRVRLGCCSVSRVRLDFFEDFFPENLD